MKHRRIQWIGPALVGVSLCYGSAAMAQTHKTKAGKGATAASSDRLARHLEAANQAYAARDYNKALELFSQLDAIEPSFNSKLAVAYCLQGTGQYGRAYETYEAILREQGSKLAPAEVARVEQGMAALRASTAVLQVMVGQAGANVSVDNADLGVTPMSKPLRRAPGQARVVVTKPGFVPFNQVIELRAGEERPLSIMLEPEQVTASVAVRCSNNVPAMLQIDGKDAGPLPFTGQLPAGQHQLVAVSSRGQSQPRVVNAVAKGSIDVELTIVETPAVLQVKVTDSAARILVNGYPMGAGSYEGAVVPGKHVVTIEKEGYKSGVFPVELVSGERYKLDNVSLESQTKTTANSAPEDYEGLYVQVSLDGLVGRPTHSVATDCPALSTGGSCSSWMTGGGQLDLRIGNSFGLLGVEGLLLAGSTVTQANINFTSDVSADESTWYGIARKERIFFVNPWIALGAAGRISSKSQTLRLTSSWGAGLAWQQGIIARTLEALPLASADSVIRKDANASTIRGKGRFLPVLLWDADIELGSTPGTKFLLGLQCQLMLGEAPETETGTRQLGYDLTGAHLPAGGGALRAWGSTNFLFGPRLGLAFGR